MYHWDNIHPLFIHFPIALLAAGFVFDFFGHWCSRSQLLKAGWYNQLLGVLSIFFAIITGLMADSKYGSLQDLFPIYNNHGPVMLIMSVLLFVPVIIRIRNEGRLPGKPIHANYYLIFEALVIVLLFYGAHLGAVLGDRL